MFFRETRETEEDIRRMFCEAREKMRMRITLKKKSDPEQFTIPCTVKGIIHFCGVFPEELRRNCERPRGVDCHEATDDRRINDPGIIAACHCGAEYKTEYSALIETHIATSIDSPHTKSNDTPQEESVDISQGKWENDYYIPTMATHTMHIEEYDEDYEEDRAIEQRATLDEEDRLLHHSSWKKKSPSIDRYVQHRSTLNLTNQTTIRYRPTTPTFHRSTLTSKLPETEITQLAFGQIIAITRATQ
ncbi:hypothetical protein DY000_02020304 [Brassica cretica]|uniref:Uncharacterized protein n=1 Tax=Brassica cretica TaxID=69181 RepID=A0ABQ7EGR5_BRACR|nr:hypothetical protein DY000_02020304 [Brassica cretica]